MPWPINKELFLRLSLHDLKVLLKIKLNAFKNKLDNIHPARVLTAAHFFGNPINVVTQNYDRLIAMVANKFSMAEPHPRGSH